MNDGATPFFLSADFRQLYRFAIVGCLNVLVSFAVFVFFYAVLPLAGLILDNLGSAGSSIRDALSEYGIRSVDAAVANIVGYAAGIGNSFLLNKTWTFRAQGDTLRQMRRFFTLNVLGLALSTFLLFIFVDLFGVSYLLVWGLATAIVMVLNFFGNKIWTFAQTPDRASPP